MIVDRGWVYSPDGATVDDATGAITTRRSAATSRNFRRPRDRCYASQPRVIARLSYAAVAKALPYPVAPVYVVALGDSVDRALIALARLTVPPLDEGPHLSYAIQWFSFARDRARRRRLRRQAVSAAGRSSARSSR